MSTGHNHQGVPTVAALVIVIILLTIAFSLS